MSEVLIVVPGEPIAQGRPKFSTRGGVFRAYDQTVATTKNTSRCLMQWWGRKPPMEGA